MCQYPFFVCPIEFNEELGRMTLDCEPSPLYRPQEYSVPASFAPLVRMVCPPLLILPLTITWFELIIILSLQLTGKNTLTIIPFLLHSLSMSVFSSVIGPFGGFFASGFKRAFKIKVKYLSCFFFVAQYYHFVRGNSKFCFNRILEILFPVMAESWTALTVNTWWPLSSTSTFLPSFAWILLKNSCSRWKLQ